MVGANTPHRRARSRWEGPPRPAPSDAPLPTRLHHREVVDRTTRDLDCFGPTREAVDRLWPAIRDRLLGTGLNADLRQSDHGFAELSVTDLTTGETTQVDVGFDSATQASVAMSIGSVRFGPWRTLPATSSSPCSAEPLRGTSLTTRCAQASPAERSSRSRPPRISVSTFHCCATLSACSAIYRAPHSRWTTPRSCSCATNSKAGAQRSAQLSTSRASSEQRPPQQ